MTDNQHPASPGQLIADRYRVEKQLATGGMGEVLAVSEQSTGRRLALKRLLEGSDERLSVMFDREYHTLASLKHPRIVEVYEYGLDRGRPYYTMELLDGRDLRELAPLPYRQACRYLRDVASSLALLHARRLLHRDISPRNVRVTSDDRCKLIDFGALSSFGIINMVVGTPPYMAPEVVQCAPLDQRADLYALGALSYWLLTGKQAFPARAVRELPELWRTPPAPPSEVLARSGHEKLEPIPRALDELVLSLLLPDPLARASSAVEVIERLNGIAGLPAEQETFSAHSYLHGTPTVGREREQATLRKRLAQTLQGTGASVVIEAAPGMGATRLLSQLALDAQLAGAVSIMVDAELHREIYGVAKALIDAVLRALPAEATAAGPEQMVQLAHLWPSSASSTRNIRPTSGLPSGELRGRTQQALASWLCEVGKRRPLVIAVDNSNRSDEASAALLATLARQSHEHPLLLVTAHKPDQPAVSPAAMLGIEEASSSLALRGLSREQTQELLGAAFGGARHTERLAQWLHRLSDGNPQACMELVHHLVETGVIRYKEGVWVLPQELSASELPASSSGALDARLARLPAEALRMAEVMCTHRGPLPIEHCLGVAALDDIEQPHAALQELTRQEVLAQSGAAYHFVQDSVRERMYQRLGPERRRTLHRRIGTFLQTQRDLDDDGKLDAGWHLMHGGAEAEGAELLGDAAASLVENTDELAAAIPALAAALAVFRRQKRPKRELIRFLAPLAMGGYRVDRRLAEEYGDEAMQVYRDLIGLELADRLRPLLGARLSVYVGLASGAVRAFFVHGYKTPRAFVKLITRFITIATMLSGTATICLDGARARAYAGCVEPLARALGKRHAAFLTHDFMCTLARLPEDRCADVVEGCRRVIARCEDPSDSVHRQLPPAAVLLLHGGAYYAMAAMAAFCDGPMALRYADTLETLGLQLYAMAAAQIRIQYHALRGDLAEASRHRQRLETLAIQAGSGWQVEVWAPCAAILVYHLTRDVIGIKAVVEELDRLREEIPSLCHHYQLARGVYHDLKDEPEKAYEARRELLDALKPRGIIGWPAVVDAQVASLIALGRAQEARELAQSVLDTMTAHDEPYIAMYQRLYTSMALAEATLGQCDAATQRLDALIEKHRPGNGPVTMGNLHAMRARIALMMNDVLQARLHLAEMERWFRPTHNPALIAQCGRLRRDIDGAGAESDRGGQAPDADAHVGTEEIASLRSVLSECAGPKERAERALELLVAHARGVFGYLYLYHPKLDRVSLVAPVHGDEAPPGVERAVLQAIHAIQEPDTEATAVVSESTAGESTLSRKIQVESSTYGLFPLVLSRHGDPIALGAVAVAQGDGAVVEPRAQVLEAITRQLFDAGDQERITSRPPRRKLGRG